MGARTAPRRIHALLSSPSSPLSPGSTPYHNQPQSHWNYTSPTTASTTQILAIPIVTLSFQSILVRNTYYLSSKSSLPVRTCVILQVHQCSQGYNPTIRG